MVIYFFYLIKIPDLDIEVGTFEVAQLARSQMEIVEADSFWCVSALLDTIQDNYTFAQPGIQRKVNNLKDLISRVDSMYFYFKSGIFRRQIFFF